MSGQKKLAFVAMGYAFSVGGSLATIGVNELFIPADVAQTSLGVGWLRSGADLLVNSSASSTRQRTLCLSSPG